MSDFVQRFVDYMSGDPNNPNNDPSRRRPGPGPATGYPREAAGSSATMASEFSRGATSHVEHDQRRYYEYDYDRYALPKDNFGISLPDAYSRLRSQYKKLLQEMQRAEKEFEALWHMYDEQKSDYNTLSSRYNSLKTNLEQRTSELQGVQKFLTTADSFSGSEVVTTLQKLNDEVQQMTTYMAEWAVENLTFKTPLTDQPTTESVEYSKASESLGARLMQLLGTRKHKENPLLLEMALRAHLVYSLYRAASPRDKGEEEKSHSVYIDGIYQRMRETEGQSISGNWRALTRAYMLPTSTSDPELEHTILSGLCGIFLAAGCTACITNMRSSLSTKFADKIHDFISLAEQVNKIISVGVISEDYEVLVARPGAAFDQGQMEDSYDSAQGGEGHQEHVLCATDLGLMQRVTVGAGAGEKGKTSKSVVVKPKVALVSVLDIIDA